MSNLPSKLSSALDTLKAQLEADISGSVVRRVVHEGDPEDVSPPSEWPTDAQVLIHLLEGDGNELEAREKGTYVRNQIARPEARFWILDRDDATRAATYDLARRKVLNSIEACAEANPEEHSGWDLEWRSWAVLRGRTDAAPYAGGRVALEVQFTE